LEAADSHSGPTLARCVEGFRQALRALGLPERIWRQEGGLALRAEEWQAFTALDGALREVAGAQLSAASEASARKLSWRDWEGFRSVLDFVASRRSYPLQRLSSRGVAVMSLQRASSGIDYDVVFVSGVRDNVLPTRPRRPWFLDESDACAIDAAGFSTEPMGNGVEADRHFFACAVRSGARVTYLTWTTCDDEGKAERRSFLVDEHLIALGITPEVEKQLTTVVPASDVMPRSWSSASSHREARLLAMWKGEEIQSDHDFSAMQRRWARRATASLAEAPEAGRFRGIVGGGWVRSRRTWSATSLNMYLSCPFRFFCRYVLGIRVAEDVRDDIDPLDRGTMMHEVMRRFYAEHLGQALDQSKLNHYMDRITAIAAQVVGEAVSLRSSVPSALSKAYYYGLAAKLMRYLEVEIKLSAACGGAWRPAYLEWKFGSEDSPVAVSANKVAVSGIVDRMDKGPDGALVIYDYKTGSVPKLEDIRNASEIQLGLYALVAQTVLGAPVAGAWYVALPDKGRDKGVFRESFKDRLNTGRSRGGMADEEWADFLASVEERIAQCEHGERAGYFPPTPSDKACRSCEYSCVCRANFDAGDAAEE
jgi:ATP-dependent helicase/nuclease subunit B